MNRFMHRMTHETHAAGARSALRIITVAVGIWFLTAFIGGLEGAFDQEGSPPAVVGLFLLVPIAGFSLAYLGSEQVRHALDSIPLWLITISHTWRFVGLGFVLGAVMHVLPPQFGYPEGLGDVAAAALCLPLARVLRERPPMLRLRAAFIAWNVFGLIDLLSAITIGILYSRSSFGVLRTDLSTALMTTFPVNLIPAFFLPLFILLHVLALIRSREIA